MTEAIARPTGWDGWIRSESLKMIAALPLTIPDQDLKRSRARLGLALSALPPDSKVYACVPESVVGCMAMSAMTGMFPGGHNPDVWLIPRRSKKHGGKLILNWQISYRGHIRLCRRTPGWDVQPVPIYRADVFERSRSSAGGASYRYEGRYEPTGESGEDWKELLGVLIIITSPKGEKWDYISRGQIEKRRRLAQDPENWNKWPIERSLGTACAWAGQRELWPTDDPTRYALQQDATQLTARVEEPRVSLMPSFQPPQPDLDETTPAEERELVDAIVGEDKPPQMGPAEREAFEKAQGGIGT